MASETIETQFELHGLIARAVENLKKKGIRNLTKGAI